MSELPLQRRASRRLIRFQARLEASVGDRWIPSIAALLLATWLSISATARIEGLDAGRDLAGYTQALWLLSNGYLPEASLFGQNVHVLELHWSFVLYPLSLLARVYDPARVLVVSQAVALGLAVFPLWKLARGVASLRIGAATALITAYALHPATHRLGVEDFHPEALAVPFLIGLVYFGATKRWVFYWLCVLAVLACRADLGLAVALWGFILLGDGERRAGLWTLGVGSIWALGLLLVVQPIFGEATVVGGQYGSYGDSLGEAVVTAVTHPLQLLGDLTARDNMSLIVSVLAPVIFLPFLSLRHLLPAVPLGALYLVTDAEGAFAERSALLLAFVFIAATFALNRLGDRGVDRVFVDGRLLSTVVVASFLLFVSSSPLAPYERSWEWAERDATDAVVLEIASQLPDDVVVRASSSALTPLAERYWIYALDGSRAPVPLIDLANTRALMILDRDIPDVTAAEREAFTALAENSGFEVTYDDRTTGVTLYYRP